jgi:hypothetical protein
MLINIIYVVEGINFALDKSQHHLRPGVFAIYDGKVQYLSADLDLPYEDAVEMAQLRFEKQQEREEAKARGVING